MSVKRLSKSDARQQRKIEKDKSSIHRSQLVARTDMQAKYLGALRTRDQIICYGPEGTGKTYLAARWGIRQVIEGKKEKLIIARPTVSKPKHRLGYRPGDQNDKIVDWLVPILDAIEDECSTTTIKKMCASGQIKFAAFETMMGRTFRDAIVILDESQNCDFGDLRLFITRMGERTQCIIDGSLEQIGSIADSGFSQIIDMVERHSLDVAIIAFTDADVVRSPQTANWVKAFRRESIEMSTLKNTIEDEHHPDGINN